MKHRLFNVLAAVSLVLLVASTGLWIRSYIGGISILWPEAVLPRQNVPPSKEEVAAMLRNRIGVQSADGWLRVWVFCPRYSRTPSGYWIGRAFEINVPLAATTLLSAVLLTYWMWKQHSLQRALSRRERGQCPHCGYDLRATPDRCPECGAVPSKPMETPA